MLNLAVFLDDAARKYPNREAVVLGDLRVSFRELDAMSNRMANLLRSRGLVPGDRVALSCANLPWFSAVYFAILKAGGVVVPLNILLKANEVEYHLEDSGARFYVCFEGNPGLPVGTTGREAFGRVDSCEAMWVLPSDLGGRHADGPESIFAACAEQPDAFEMVATDATDTAVILYSSGTTGRPKGAELTHSNMVLNALSANRLCGADEAVHERYLVTLPLFHSFGQTMLQNAGFSVGATLVMLPRFEAHLALEIMAQEQINVFAGVPTMYWGLLDALSDDAQAQGVVSSLRLAMSGGSAMPVELLARFRERFAVSVCEGYGLSETSPMVLSEPPGQDYRPGSVGVPVWGVEVKLMAPDGSTIHGAGVVGEIAVRGHNVMKGYVGRPEATAEVIDGDGWFRTGDLAKRDDDGWYYIVDRAKELIIRGGYNVYPREVEEVLMSHPDVSLVAVVGVPDSELGEEVKAFVIPVEGAALTADTLRAWAKEQLAAYKYPRHIVIMSEFPMTASGKVLKRELG